MFSNWRIKININSMLLILLVLLSNILLFCYSDTEKEIQVLVLMSVLIVALLIVNASSVINRNTLFALCVCIASIGVTCFTYGAAGTGLTVICVIICNIIFKNICLSKKMFDLIHFLSAIGIIFFLVQFDITTISARFVVSPSGGYLNTNIYGILVLAVVFHLYCIINVIKQKMVRKIVFVGITVYGAYLIWISGCRTAIISLCVALGLLLLKTKCYEADSYKMIIKCVMWIIIIFPVLYILLYHNTNNMTFLGKNLFSGRQLIWENAFKSVLEHPVLGSGNSIKIYSGGLYTEVCHNMLISVLKAFGTVPFFMFVNSFYNKSNIKNMKCIVNKYAQFAFISCLFIGIGENFMTYGQLCLPFCLFGLMNINKDE